MRKPAEASVIGNSARFGGFSLVLSTCLSNGARDRRLMLAHDDKPGGEQATRRWQPEPWLGRVRTTGTSVICPGDRYHTRQPDPGEPRPD